MRTVGSLPDYICEAVDQTRGWFYSLHAISSLVFGEPCFRNVICLGHILDENGEKMSKSKGNVVKPWSVLDAQGADALRWYLYTASPPGNPRRFSGELVQEAIRKFMLTLWNTYSFFVTYANIDEYQPSGERNGTKASGLDRWIESELHRLVKDVTDSLDNYDPTNAGRRIEGFVDVLSNWYVRRSRRRFWKSENDAEKQSAYDTLYGCLVSLSKLIAPFTPFLAEELYRNLVYAVDSSAPESVHLASFPEADESLIDPALNDEARLAMKISSLGRAARSKAGIKVRQPLASVKVMVRDAGEREALQRSFDQVGEELKRQGAGVRRVTIGDVRLQGLGEHAVARAQIRQGHTEDRQGPVGHGCEGGGGGGECGAQRRGGWVHPGTGGGQPAGGGEGRVVSGVGGGVCGCGADDRICRNWQERGWPGSWCTVCRRCGGRRASRLWTR